MKEIIDCPLCSSHHFDLIKEYNTTDLSFKWLSGFGFNPFKKFPSVLSFSKYCCKKCSLIFYDPELIGDEELYKQLMKFDWYHEAEKWEFNEALNLINRFQPQSLLEVGCANGNFLRKITHHVHAVEGIEINETLVKECISNKLNVSSKTPGELTSKYDMIVLFQVLEHLGELHKTMGELVNLLNQNGILIISVPNPESYLKEIDPVLLDLPPHHSVGWTTRAFDYLTGEFHLRNMHYSTEPLRFVHYNYYRKEKFVRNQSPSGSHSKTFSEKIIFRLQYFLYRQMNYWKYLADKNKMTGQTHLIALQKIN